MNEITALYIRGMMPTGINMTKDEVILVEYNNK